MERSLFRVMAIAVISTLAAMEDIMLDTKTNAKFTCLAAVVLSFATLSAGQTSTQDARKPGDLDRIRKVSTLIGTGVMNHTNTKIAVVRDLAFSREGAALYVLLGWGGVAGVGESYTAMPFELLGIRHDDGKWAVNLDLTTEDLKRAPVIKSENYRELWDPQWVARLDQFVRLRGEVSAASGSNGRGRTARAPDCRSLAPRHQDSWRRHEEYAEPGSGKGRGLVVGSTDHVAFVIIGRGGVLGVNENYIPIPWAKLGLGENRETAAVSVAIDATKAQLEKAPLVKGDNYATLLAPGFADQVREYFGVAKPARQRVRQDAQVKRPDHALTVENGGTLDQPDGRASLPLPVRSCVVLRTRSGQGRGDVHSPNDF